MNNNNKIKKQEQIDRYVLGEMTQDEKASFKKQLMNDQQLSEEVEFRLHIVRAFQYESEQKVFDALKTMTEEELKKIITSDKPNQKDNKRSLFLGLSVTAAAVICLLLYIGTRPKYTTLELLSHYYITQPYETYPSRGGNDLTINEKKLMQKAKNLYENKAFEQALAIYDSILMLKQNLQSIPNEILFYAAICQFETGNTAGAIDKIDLSGFSGTI